MAGSSNVAPREERAASGREWGSADAQAEGFKHRHLGVKRLSDEAHKLFQTRPEIILVCYFKNIFGWLFWGFAE